MPSPRSAPLIPAAAFVGCFAIFFATHCVAAAALLSTDLRTPLAEGWERGQSEAVCTAIDGDGHGSCIEKGGLVGPKLPVKPFGHYRLTLAAKGEKRALMAAVFLDGQGREIASDVYDAIDPSLGWQNRTLCFRAHPDAAHVRIRLESQGAPLCVRDLAVAEATPDEVATWCDSAVAQCPIVDVELPADRGRHLSRTLGTLRDGGRLRIVMLGDSICNDTSNSLYEVILARAYPSARIEVATSVRGATGCWYYKDDNRVADLVLRHDPDLLVIAGISHRFDPEAIRSVIRQVRAGSDCEVLVMTGAVAPEGPIRRAHLKNRPVSEAIVEMEQFVPRLTAIARDEKVELFDMRRAWDDYMLRSRLDFDFIARDDIHANGRGKQILARLLVRYLTPPANATHD